MYSRKKRKGQFFEIDAVIAVSLLLIGIIYVRNLDMPQPQIDQNAEFSKESIRLFRTLKIGDLNESIITQLENSQLGLYTDRNFSVAKQIGIYFFRGNTSLAENLSKTMIDKLIPANYGYSVVINSGGIETDIANRSSLGAYQDVSVTRTMVTGLEQSKPIIGKLARLYLGNVRSNLREYVFFGGYIGQGNISFKMELPSNFGGASEVNFEGYVGADIDVKVNNWDCGQISRTLGGKTSITQTSLACGNRFTAGINNISFEFKNSHIYEQYLGGGFLEVVFTTSDFYTQQKRNRTYIPGIKGRINIFDSVFFDGNFNESSFKINLSFDKTDTYPIVFNFGNDTLFQTDVVGTYNVVLNKSNFSSNLLSRVENKTVPFRFGTLEILKGDSDIVWVTDRSDGVDLTSVKNSGKKYTQKILDAIDNNISLIGYGTDLTCPVQQYDFTGDASIINATINGYSSNCGESCIGCAMFRSNELLEMSDNLRANLEAWWKFDSNGSVQEDSSGNGNNGSCLLGTNCPSFNGVGKIKGALEFNGSTDYIDTGSTFSSVFDDSFSISIWAKPKDVFNVGEYFFGTKNLAAEDYVEIELKSMGQIQFYYMSDTNAAAARTNSQIFFDGQDKWHHLLAVADSTVAGVGGLKIYVDGVEQTLNATNNGDTTGVTFANWASSDELFIGARNFNGAAEGFFNGSIDDVIIFDKALTDLEVKEVYKKSRRGKFIVLLADNETNYAWDESGGFSYLNTSYAPTQAIDYAREACIGHNISILTVAFGNLSASTTLDAMATANNILGCDGLYFEADNATMLDKVLENISIIVNSKFQSIDEQEAIFDNILSGDSYIEFETTKPSIGVPDTSIRFMSKTERFGDIGGNPCDVNIDMSGFDQITEARLTSYSSDLWSSRAVLGGSDLFDLSEYGTDFRVLGDPFLIHIPDSMLPGSMIYDIQMETAKTSVVPEGCSYFNRMIYTAHILKSYEIYSGIKEAAEGCIWAVSFADGSSKSIKAPYDYAGARNCQYSPGLISYNSSDAIDIVMYNLLRKLDVNPPTGDIEISLSESDLEISAQTIKDIPFLWGPAMIEVRVWR